MAIRAYLEVYHDHLSTITPYYSYLPPWSSIIKPEPPPATLGTYEALLGWIMSLQLLPTLN